MLIIEISPKYFVSAAQHFFLTELIVAVFCLYFFFFGKLTFPGTMKWKHFVLIKFSTLYFAHFVFCYFLSILGVRKKSFANLWSVTTEELLSANRDASINGYPIEESRRPYIASWITRCTSSIWDEWNDSNLRPYVSLINDQRTAWKMRSISSNYVQKKGLARSMYLNHRCTLYASRIPIQYRTEWTI